MTVLLSIFANDVLPVFIVAAIGFALARVLHVDVRGVSRVTFNALSPCLVFHLMVTSSVSPSDFGRMTALTFIVILGIGVTARLASLPFRLDRATLSAFLVVVMFSNSGNYGLPVVLFAFGQDALAHAAVYFVGNAVAGYSLGVLLASAGRRSLGTAAKRVLSVPPVWAVAVAGVVLALGLRVPQPIMRSVELLADGAMPVMILVLGMQLERTDWPERPGLVLLAGVLSLVVTPLIALGASEFVGLTGPARQAAILQSGMPSAVFTTILALEFEVAPAFVTACVTFTTLMSPISVTLLIAAMK